MNTPGKKSAENTSPTLLKRADFNLYATFRHDNGAMDGKQENNAARREMPRMTPNRKGQQ